MRFFWSEQPAIDYQKNYYGVLEKKFKNLSYSKFYDNFINSNFEILGLINQFLEIIQKNIGVRKILKLRNINPTQRNGFHIIVCKGRIY